MLAYLRARPVDHLSPGAKPPVTQWLEDLMEHSRDGLEVWLLEQIAEGKGIFEPDVVRAEDILTLLQTGVGSHWVTGALSPPRIHRALRAIGATPHRRGAYRDRCWKIRKGGRGGRGAGARRAGNILHMEVAARARGRDPREEPERLAREAEKLRANLRTLPDLKEWADLPDFL